MPLLREALTAIRVVFVGNAILATLAYLLPLRQLSRAWFILFGVLAALLLRARKGGACASSPATSARRVSTTARILIVGTGRRAHRSRPHDRRAQVLGLQDPRLRLRRPPPVERVGALSASTAASPIFDGSSRGGQFAEPIDEIVFAVTRKKLDEMKQIFLMCEELGIRTRVAMNFFPNRVARVELEELEGIPFLTFTTTPSNETQLALKRLLDVAVSMLLLLLALPVIGIAALAIKLSSPGSVLFKQERIGLNGRIFTLYKFRTMIEDAHERRGEVDASERDDRAGVQGEVRSAHHRRRPRPAQVLARRAAAALERAEGRHEPGRPAPADPRGGRGVSPVASPPAVDEAGTDVPLAGQRPQQRRLRPLDAARPAVHRQLVAVARSEDSAAHDSGGVSPAAARRRCDNRAR